MYPDVLWYTQQLFNLSNSIVYKGHFLYSFIHCLLTGLHKWTWPGTAFMVELMTFSHPVNCIMGIRRHAFQPRKNNSTEFFLFVYSCLYWKNENQLNGRKKMLNFLSLLIKEIIEILYTLTGCGFFIKKKDKKIWWACCPVVSTTWF